MVTFLPRTLRSICPYCTFSQNISYAKSYPQALLVQCQNPSCAKQWHEGAYLSAILQIEQFSKHGRGIDQPPIFRIRAKHGSGSTRYLVFQTNVDIVFKKNDTIGLSISKQVTGRFRKQWTGEWRQQPTIFLNATLDYFWILPSI
jgi:hypothetical protein